MILADIMEILSSSWQAGLLMISLGFIFAVVLLIASIKLKVQVDPQVEAIIEALPGIDCGGCGFAGCSSYAKAVHTNPELIGKCAPGGADVSARIAQILNLELSGSGPMTRPVVKCHAHIEDKIFYADYVGIESCTSANALPSVMACKYGCLDFGDCVKSCQFDAIHVVNGLAEVDYSKCTGCGACVKACPRGIIEMVPFHEENMLAVRCKSQETGKDTRGMCKVGCISCKMCTKQSDMFVMNGNVAEIDYSKYSDDEKAHTAAGKCPTKVIEYVGPTAHNHKMGS